MSSLHEPRLEWLRVRGGLEAIDLHVAAALARIGRDDDPDVALAAALASRAPRHGHICAELDRPPDDLRGEGADTAAAHVEWPALASWLATLSRSPLVRRPGDGRNDTPLVLDGARLYLDRYWRYQARLLEAVRARASARVDGVDEALLRDGLDRLFPPAPGAAGVDRQRLAALMAVLRRLTVISGGPGTGKTTTVKKILALLLEQHDRAAAPDDQRPLRIELAAPTAKAAARIAESFGEGLDQLATTHAVKERILAVVPKTLHRLLGAGRSGPTDFRYGRHRPLPADIVVVDESSMVDFVLMTRLVEAVPAHARLVLLGDKDQLASVEAGSVLGDICGGAGHRPRFSATFAHHAAPFVGASLAGHAEIVPDEGVWDALVHLDKVHRFGEASGIRAVARAINAGDAGDTLAFLRGTATAEAGPGAAYADVALHEVGATGHLPDPSLAEMVDGYLPLVDAVLAGDRAAALAALSTFRVLCAHRRGPLGVEGVVHAVEQGLERARPGFRTDHPWYLGRPVLVRENDYSVGLFNGDAGIVLPHPETGARAVAFAQPSGEVRYVEPARLPPHVTVFATTVHQGQGSQFRHVVLVLPPRPSPILTRELVYTGVTRASRRATVVAVPDVLRAAVVRRVRRASGLPGLLWGARAEAGQAAPVREAG
jgi:exodeoxyribonuclease V alpha subunit